ncbi:MAG: CARDB domain-containing protein [Candidatus Nanopelagicales bacterium]
MSWTPRTSLALVGALVISSVALAPADAAAKRADLTVTTVSVSPRTVVQGGTVTVTAKVRNAGKKKAGASQVEVVLSADGTRSSNDVRLALASVKALATKKTSATITVRAKVPASIGARSWTVLVCSDPGKKVKESKESNNCRAATARLAVTTPPVVVPPTNARGGEVSACSGKALSVGDESEAYHLSISPRPIVHVGDPVGAEYAFLEDYPTTVLTIANDGTGPTPFLYADGTSCQTYNVGSDWGEITVYGSNPKVAGTQCGYPFKLQPGESCRLSLLTDTRSGGSALAGVLRLQNFQGTTRQVFGVTVSSRSRGYFTVDRVEGDGFSGGFTGAPRYQRLRLTNTGSTSGSVALAWSGADTNLFRLGGPSWTPSDGNPVCGGSRAVGESCWVQVGFCSDGPGTFTADLISVDPAGNGTTGSNRNFWRPYSVTLPNNPGPKDCSQP